MSGIVSQVSPQVGARISEPLAKHQQNIMISARKSDTLHGTVGAENAIHQRACLAERYANDKQTMRLLADRTE